MIGSCSAPVATNTIVQSPPGIVVSNYFAYGLTGYFIASTINPGYGYWVKCSGPGTLTLNCVSNVAKTSPVEDPVEGLSALTIQDSKGRSQTLYFGAGVNKSPELFSLPPSAPGEQFDVRFASQRMAELVPTDLKAAVEYAIQLQSVAYPVTITWNVKNSSDVSYDISYRNGKKDMVRRSMLSAGRLQLRQPVEGLKLTAKPGHAEIPLQYALDQNYPNPFNPTTEIRFALPVDAHVTLKVFTITGQVVAELIDGDQEAGFHSITWDSRNISSEQISSGVYFYRLVATDVNNPSNSFDQVKKMMLMK
ncbi:MAG: T9SS type A sorting domain-containing protein [Ignavibacteria bacterium]|nr:T9SS type A sorting domain-containing protein [Ignavibacteria bacterium]